MIIVLKLLSFSILLIQSNSDAKLCPEETQLLSLKNGNDKSCKIYGCPQYPKDLMDSETDKYLSSLDTKKSIKETCATLTLTGKKGQASLNQDRAFVIPDYRVQSSIVSSSSAENDDTICVKNQESVLLGVFDGHGHEGELVSQHAMESLPKLLHDYLRQESQVLDNSQVKEALIQSFLDINATSPPESMGGATGSVMYQQNNQVFIANAGDSRSFLASYKPSTNSTEILFVTVEHKPNLPEEKARIDATKYGQVYIPPNPSSTSRVVYYNRLGGQVGLAMSRSLGDHDASKAGVIATPQVDIINLRDILNSYKHQCSNEDNDCDGLKDIKIFGVSATDGLLDEVSLEQIANKVAYSLYGDGNAQHLLHACKDLIIDAARGWGYRYRDDIAIALSHFDFS